VDAQQVVLGQAEAADGCSAVDAAVWALPVVAEQEGGQFRATLLRGVVGAGTGPLAQGRLDEALGLAVGLRRVGPGALMADVQASQCLGVASGFEGGPVVGHDALDPDAVAAEEAQGVDEEGEAGAALLVGVDLGIGQPGVVVDGQVQVLPADAAARTLAGAIAGDAVADAREATELLDVDVDQLARLGALVAAHGLGRLKVFDAAQAVAAQHPADGGRRDGQITGDLRAGQTLPAQGHDGFLRLGRGRAVQLVRPRGAILQPGGPFGLEAGHPLAHRLGAHAHRRGHRLRAEPALGQPHQSLSTRRRQTRILVDVHPVAPGSLKPRNSSVLGSDRMDNLLKAHS
jgi:hypothetical protein